MAQVKAKCAVYLGPDVGYRTEGEVFEYSGPKNLHLEAIKAAKQEEQPAEQPQA